MNKKHRNKSSQRHQEEKNHGSKAYYDRKCHTPSLYSQPKKKTKSKDKSIDKKSHYNSIKQINSIEPPIASTHHKKQSPFKHKNRPISNLTNVRHAKNLQHQLSRLHESAYRNDSSYLDESGSKKTRYDPAIQKILDEGKKLMKKNHFEKGAKVFRDCLNRDSDNTEAYYLLGVCYFHLQVYDEVIKSLTAVLLRDDHYRKNVYLFLAIAEKKMGNCEDSILTLTKAIAFYPKYYDALILRAKILTKQKRYYDAVEDLNKCIKIDPQNVQAYISKADCLRSLAQYKESIMIYTEILKGKLDLQIILKRGIAFIENNQIPEALDDLNLIISKSHNNSEAFLFKGLAYSKIQNYNEAILSYEQAIKFNTSKKATTKAIYEITKLKIDLGDYYGASYTLERSNSLEVEAKVLDKMKMFTEGSTSIMKKKFKRGIENLTILAKKENLNDQLRPLIYSFRSYGYFSQHKFSNSIHDLNNLIKLGYSLDKACSYNYSLLQGIIACQNNQFNDAIEKFTEAESKRNDFADPQIYKALVKICQYNRIPRNRNGTLLDEALIFIGHALEKDESANNFYICACILYEMGEFDEALENVEKAIDKSEEHSMKHLYLKAMIHGMMGMVKEALKGFYNVLSVLGSLKEKEKDAYDPDEPEQEKQIPETYLNRAKCYLLFGEKKKAFQDLQTYIAKKPLDSQVHSVAGQLLFSIGAFEDAVKAYNYSPNIQKHKQTLLERMKCYLLLKELNYCLRDMEKLDELGNSKVKFDYYCLDALKQASKSTQNHYQEALKKISVSDSPSEGIIFKKSDMLFYKGFLNFQLKNYEDALRFFTKSKTLKALNNQIKIVSEDLEEEQFENTIYTDKQIDYNIAVTQLMLGKESTNCIEVLSKYEAWRDFFKNQEEEELMDLTPFPVANRLCSIFPETTLKENVKFRLSFCLPEVLPPEIKFQIDDKILKDLNMSTPEPRPDAPWIKRNSHGVIFTDEIMGFDVDLKTEKSLGVIKIQPEQQEHNEEKEKLRQLLSLDVQVEQKLQKMMHKKKN